jgi:hypothetical protein
MIIFYNNSCFNCPRSSVSITLPFYKIKANIHDALNQLKPMRTALGNVLALPAPDVRPALIDSGHNNGIQRADAAEGGSQQ